MLINVKVCEEHQKYKIWARSNWETKNTKNKIRAQCTNVYTIQSVPANA